LLNEAIREYGKRGHNAALKSIVIQSADWSWPSKDSQLSRSESLSTLEKNIFLGHELRLRSRDDAKLNDGHGDGLPPIYHLHLSLGNSLQAPWLASTKQPPQSSTSYSDDVDSLLHTLFPALAHAFQGTHSRVDELHALMGVLRQACFKTVVDAHTTIQLIDVRPLLAIYLLQTLRVVLPSPDLTSDVGPDVNHSLMHRFYKSYIEPWDFLLSLSALSMRIVAKYSLMLMDGVGSVVRSVAVDPLLTEMGMQGLEKDAKPMVIVRDEKVSPTAFLTGKQQTKYGAATGGGRKPVPSVLMPMRCHFLIDDVSSRTTPLSTVSTKPNPSFWWWWWWRTESSNIISNNNNCDYFGLSQYFQELGLATTTLSKMDESVLQVDCQLPALDNSGGNEKTVFLRTILSLSYNASWYCFHSLRYSCSWIHDQLATLTGVAVDSLLQKTLTSTEGSQMLFDQQQESEPMHKVIVTVVQNVEEVPYRLQLLTHRYPRCHIALLVNTNSEDSYSEFHVAVLTKSIAYFTTESRKIILVDPRHMVEPLCRSTIA
jgi:hypothetical protein